MKKILVTSYLAGTEKQLREFVKENPTTNKEVLFIPTAGNVEEYTGYIGEGIEVFKKLGFKINRFDLSRETQEKCHQEISNAHFICVSGGNTFYLLQEIRKKKLERVIQQKITNGCPYIGESAGGIILAKDIEYCKVMDDPSQAPELSDYQGLNVVGFYPVPHYGEEPFVEAAQKIYAEYQEKLRLISMNNTQVIRVERNI